MLTYTAKSPGGLGTKSGGLDTKLGTESEGPESGLLLAVADKVVESGLDSSEEETPSLLDLPGVRRRTCRMLLLSTAFLADAWTRATEATSVASFSVRLASASMSSRALLFCSKCARAMACSVAEDFLDFFFGEIALTTCLNERANPSRENQ